MGGGRCCRASHLPFPSPPLCSARRASPRTTRGRAALCVRLCRASGGRRRLRGSSGRFFLETGLGGGGAREKHSSFLFPLSLVPLHHTRCIPPVSPPLRPGRRPPRRIPARACVRRPVYKSVAGRGRERARREGKDDEGGQAYSASHVSCRVPSLQPSASLPFQAARSAAGLKRGRINARRVAFIRWARWAVDEGWRSGLCVRMSGGRSLSLSLLLPPPLCPACAACAAAARLGAVAVRALPRRPGCRPPHRQLAAQCDDGGAVIEADG